MGRISTRYVAGSALEAISVCLDVTRPERLTECNRSGNERAHATARMWAIDDTCSWCGLATVLSSHKGALTAVMSLIVTSGMVPANNGKRCGYILGNVVLACTACADARGAAMRRGLVADWDATVIARAEEVRAAEVWTGLDRAYRLPTEGGAVLGMVEAWSENHRENARVARVERGFDW